MPSWKGTPFVVVGVLLVVFMPKIAAWNVRQRDRTHRRMMRWFGLEDAPIARVGENRAFARYALFMQGFICLVLGILLIVFGVAALLGQVPAR